MPIQNPVRTVEVVANHGREGLVEASDRSLRFDLSAEAAPSSEHLFAAAYASCFHAALLSAAERAHTRLTGSSVIARVTLGEDERGGYLLAVELRATMPGTGRGEAERLLHAAHDTCPYSRALRGDVTVTLHTD